VAAYKIPQVCDLACRTHGLVVNRAPLGLPS